MLILYYVWEQERFNNLYIFASEGGTPSTFVEEYYKNGKIPFVKIEDTLKKYIYSTKNFITELGLNKSSAWIIKKDNIIFTNGATVGNISINKIDLSTKQGILGIILKENFNVEFIYYLLNTINFKNKINQIKTKGTFDILTLNNIDTIKINIINNKNEQLKISNLLSKIDSLIALHQRELKILKIFKKSLLQKMIVGKNLTILSVSLTKITNVWEQERFGNIYQKYSVKNNFRLDFNKYISIATNTYKNDFTNISKDTLGNYILFKKGYVAFEGHTNIQFPFGRFVMNTIGDGIVSNIFSVFKPVFAQDLYYWKYAINNNKVMLEALKKSSKSGIMMNTLDIEVLNQQIILFPNQKEQNLIGSLFVLLDSLIALHQRGQFRRENEKKIRNFVL
ncbi:restriction endonuclease subunit S [Mycoplasmopsis cynos]|uniref:restriction endonuclease subunit S n=1 Tax=Mycoplasmopsis cynos TaxID=171284 RepID=UPI002AFE6E75|nr:restriction endonuclease subunit S [Mycoplasmopsis cynos]WQQ19152.1 restriction endonuclease subunit S [Mycoplasmopsis cynos]